MAPEGGAGLNWHFEAETDLFNHQCMNIIKGIPWKDKSDRKDFTRVYEYGYNRQEKKLSQHCNTKYSSASLRQSSYFLVISETRPPNVMVRILVLSNTI